MNLQKTLFTTLISLSVVACGGSGGTGGSGVAGNNVSNVPTTAKVDIDRLSGTAEYSAIFDDSKTVIASSYQLGSFRSGTVSLVADFDAGNIEGTAKIDKDSWSVDDGRAIKGDYVKLSLENT